MNQFARRISELRAAMKERGLHAYIVPSSDPHQSEYVAERWQARQWLSGFTGSAGTLIVTADFAGLWTDSRYFLQGESQLEGSGIELMKLKVPHTPEYLEWLAENLPQGGLLGFDGQVVALQQVGMWRRHLQGREVELEPRYDLISEIWTDRPPPPASEVSDFPEEMAGESRIARLDKLRKWMDQEGLDRYLLVALDEIAWLLNIRASDVDFNPVCVSYLLVDRKEAHWFCGPDRVPEELTRKLNGARIFLHSYHQLKNHLGELSAETTLGLDPATTSVRVHAAAGNCEVIRLASPVGAWKGRKNATELKHLRQVMRRDGVALLRLWRWLEEALERGETPTEAEVADRLNEMRARDDRYRGPSFSSIVGYRANGAIVHYRPEHGSSAPIHPEGLLLIDSGGQYTDGTTDITRTFSLGKPTTDEQLHFTLVLKGHIALDRARFPAGTTGVQLDTLARAPLWRAHLDYGHGTGHGIGFFLNVHEGPQGIAASPRSAKTQTPIVPGMVTSNEPGYYPAGRYGIRIENLILAKTDGHNEFGPWLCFETLTLFPIDRRLIAVHLLRPEELDWLNAYHEKVERELSPLLDKAEKAWLRQACAPLEVATTTA